MIYTSLKVGLKMNMKSTRCNNHLIGLQVMIGNGTVELMDKYTYLGQIVSANSAQEKEIRRRIGKGWGAFGR